MNEVFSRGPTLTTRLIIVIALSLAAMLVDTKVDSFEKARSYLSSLVSPIQYFANLPGAMLDWSADRFTTRQQLMQENENLKSQITMMNAELQRFDVLKQENISLRKLLDAPVQNDMYKMITELMAVDTNPYSHQIVINKGSLDGVYPAQSVLDDRGIVGQISEVSTTNSRVILITDVTHAIPVRIQRNNVRFVANGGGKLDSLTLQHVAHSADIQVGDMLLSSGLGKVFPEGYPVGKVTNIVRNESRPFADVSIEPIAKLDRLKYLLLLWPSAVAPESAIAPAQTRRAMRQQNE